MDKTTALNIRCSGNLTVRGDAGATVRVSGQAQQDLVVEDDRVQSSNDVAIRVPNGRALHIEHVGGNANIRGVSNDITVGGAIGGNLSLRAINGRVEAGNIGGNLAARSVDGEVTAKNVGGSATISSVGSAALDHVSGDLSVKHVNGNLTAVAVGGDMAVRHVAGNIQVDKVVGDTVLAHLAGVVNVTSKDDIRLRGPLAPGKHHLTAGSSLVLRYPTGHAVEITATAPKIRNQISFDTVSEEDGYLSGSVGEGGPQLNLTAGEKIALRASDTFEEEMVFDAEFDFAEIGEKIASEINMRMADIQQRFGPEVNVQAEKALRRAQAAIDRAAARIERNAERAQREMERQQRRTEARAKRHSTHKQRAEPQPTASAKQSRASESEQLKILKMLEEGTLTLDEANELLAALD